MLVLARCAAAGLTALLLAGGCPLTPTQTTIPSAGDTPAAAPDTSANTAGQPTSGTATSTGGRGPASFGEQLAIDFPSCTEPRRGAEDREQILILVNQARARAGLDPVRRNTTLEQQAAHYACEMIHYEFFAHINPVTQSTLSDRADQFGYDYRLIGENLAGGQTTPAQAFQSWMDSPAHRDNILEPRFTELGVAVREGGPLNIYWVQEFGQPPE